VSPARAIAEPEGFDAGLIACGRRAVVLQPRRFTSSPLLAALRRAGTAHIYADTADATELEATTAGGDGSLPAEIDGTTVNQPLVRRVLDRYLTDERGAACLHDLRASAAGVAEADLAPLLYTAIAGWIGNDLVAGFGAGRPWEVSLQLPMGATGDPAALRRLGGVLHRMVPSCLVKVPFTPHAPHCILVARDLERDRIPVNFTSTFSARQVVVAALLADVSRTNIFMGRLNQGLGATLLGEHVDLEAQRGLRSLRGRTGIRTQLIVASIRDWRSLVWAAGCDVFTTPCAVLRDLITQEEVPPEAIERQLETSYEDRLRLGDEALEILGAARIARLWRVEPELIEFLLAYRASAEYRELRDGERLARRFDEAGFGDVFYAPTPAEWTTLGESKLPKLGSPLTARITLDTLYSLLADADFAKEQEAIDRAVATHAARAPAAA
jgi:transaldolase